MDAHIVGTGIVPFGVHTETPVADLGVTAARSALDAAGIEYRDIGEVVCSSMLSPPQTALKVAHRLGMTGAPVTAIESASAGGLVALRHAARVVASGECEYALAIGYEKVTALTPGGVVPAPTSPWDRFPPQLHYAIEVNRWLHDHGCTSEVIAAVAAKSWNQARGNPNAARRADDDVQVADVLSARMVAAPLTRMMCHVGCDGAAAVVVSRHPSEGSIRLSAIAQTSQPEDVGWPRVGPVVGPPSQATLTAQRAFASADLSPSVVDVVSIHDMCSSEEVTTLVALGLASPDEVIELALSGGLASTGRLPTNTDGGCVARGHPMGATGLAQAAEVVAQLRGEAGPGQVPDADVGLVHAAGGGGSCVVALLQT